MTAELLEEHLRDLESAVAEAVIEGPRSFVGRDPPPPHVTRALVAAVFGLYLGVSTSGADDLREIGARYASAGVSQAQALHEFHRAVIELSCRSWRIADPSDVEVLLQMAQVFEQEVEAARAALGEGYRAASAASGTRSVSRRQLTESLLTGRPVNRPLLLVANLDIAHHYLVLCTHAPVPLLSVDDIANRMRVPGALGHRRDGVLWVLVPASRHVLHVPAQAAALGFARLADAMGATVAGVGIADVATLDDAAALARAVLDIAAACDLRGPVFAEDVRVERALMGCAEALTELAGVIEALSPWPHLPRTLQALYDHDLDRSRTADALHIARRTLTKRLDRIHELSGVHPTSARGVQTFMSALAARRLGALATVRPDVPGPPSRGWWESTDTGVRGGLGHRPVAVLPRFGGSGAGR